VRGSEDVTNLGRKSTTGLVKGLSPRFDQKEEEGANQERIALYKIKTKGKEESKSRPGN